MELYTQHLPFYIRRRAFSSPWLACLGYCSESFETSWKRLSPCSGQLHEVYLTTSTCPFPVTASLSPPGKTERVQCACRLLELPLFLCSRGSWLAQGTVVSSFSLPGHASLLTAEMAPSYAAAHNRPLGPAGPRWSVERGRCEFWEASFSLNVN